MLRMWLASYAHRRDTRRRRRYDDTGPGDWQRASAALKHR